MEADRNKLSKKKQKKQQNKRENLLQLSSSLASLQSGTLSQRKCRPTHDPSSHWNSSERQFEDEPPPPPAESTTGGAAVELAVGAIVTTLTGVVVSVTTKLKSFAELFL